MLDKSRGSVIGCGDVVEEAQELRLGPFTLEEPIGQGGMGEVWRARHHRQGVPVAVKVITDQAARDPEVRRAFDNEVRSVARLDHPGIVEVLEYGSIDAEAASRSEGRLVEGSPFLAMEWLSGGVLDTSAAPSNWEELRDTLQDLLSALAHAHSRGLVHRDLTPGNILFAGPEARFPGLRITDFGIAHALVGDEADEDAESHSGTVLYMSPEQLHGRWRDHGPWTDLYAVGCIAWELATGGRPVEGDTIFSIVFARLNGSLARFEPRIEVPSRFEDWVRRLLERDARDRFRWAADAAFALDELTSAAVFGPPPLPRNWVAGSEERRPPSQLLDAGTGLLGLRSLPALGRDAEMDLLWSSLRDVWMKATPRAVLLKGGDGSGRSHLARSFCERAAEVGGANWLWVGHDRMPTERTGLAAMVAGSLGVRGMERDALVERVVEVLGQEGVTDRWEVASVLQLVAPTEGANDGGDLPPVRFAMPRERNMVVQRFLRRQAAERPVILVLDDLQWGSESVSFITHLLAEPVAAVGPVLIVGTCDSMAAESSPWFSSAVEELSEAPRLRVVDVLRLDEESCFSLAHSELGLSAPLATQLAARTDGNPSLAMEVVGEWVRSGRVEPSPEGLVLRGGLELEEVLPDSVEAIWRARIARVVEGFGPDAYETLELAAALGRQVDAFEWNHACGRARLRAEASLIDALLTEGLALQDEAGWSFRSESLRAELERSARDSGRWERWNEAAAVMVQQRFPQGGKGVPRRRALHLLEAGAVAEALSELGEAAWEFVEANEFTQALSMIERREAALSELGAGPSDPRWGECMLVRCGVRVHLGQHELALEEARKAEVEACRYGWSNVLARAIGQQAVVALEAGDREEAAERWDEAIRLCSSRDVETRARLLWYLAEVRRQAGDLEAAQSLHEGASEQFARRGDSEGQGEASLGLALVAHDQGALDSSEDFLARAEPLFEKAGSRSGIAAALNLRATVAHLRGDLDSAARHYRRSVELLESTGSPSSVESLLKLGLVHALRRDFAGLEQCLHRIDTAGRPSARTPWEGQITVFRLALLAFRRDWALWGRTLGESEELLQELPGNPEEVATLARIAGELAQTAGKEELARAAYTLADRQRSRDLEAPGFTIVDGMLSRLPKLT